MISKKMMLVFLTLMGFICISLILDPVQTWVESTGVSPWLLGLLGLLGLFGLMKYGVRVL